jgi:nucleotide-binding universal stress UspA family protein
VITGAVRAELLSDPNWRLDPGDLVMRAGRPVLITPEPGASPGFGTMVLGWKDNRESRRAAADLLPLGRLVERVIVASIAEDGDQAGAHAGADDVVAWFGRHGIRAEARLQPLVSHPAQQLRELARDEGADLIAVGAYGYSRTREWMLGGVTRDFLTGGASQHVLLSH